MGFFDDVSNFFSSAYHKAESVVTTVYNDVKSGVSSIFHSADNNIRTALNTVKDDAALLINKGASTVTALGKDVEQSIGDVTTAVPKVTQSLSMPLMIAGGAAILFALKK